MRYAHFLIYVFMAAIFCGCSSRPIPSTVELSQHYGAYLSVSNSAHLPAVIELQENNKIVGNTYATVEEALAVIAAGYVADAGNFTGRIGGGIGYTDPESLVHVNMLNIALEPVMKPKMQIMQLSYGFAYFDGWGNLILPESNGTLANGFWSGTFIQE